MKQFNDPIQMFRSAKTAKVVQSEQPKKRAHAESDLQLAFCKWVRFQYPKVDFIRHEREAKRSLFMGQLMGKYNTLGGIPDWECLNGIGAANGLYIEFKKPGESWLNKHGQVKPAYAHQYACHKKLWSLNRPAYFCNSLEDAMDIFTSYWSGIIVSPQEYDFTEEDKKKYLVDNFEH